MNHTVSYSEVRKSLKKNFDRVCADHLPLLVTRKNGDNVVLISEADYSALEETAYLSRSPKNLAMLLDSLGRADEQGTDWEEVKRDLGV